MITSFTITQSDILEADASAIGESSENANDGTATTSVSGGTSPYSYLWSTGSTQDNITNVAAGTYYLTVTDTNNCQVVDSVIINNIGGATLTITVNDVSCYGMSDGSATVTATGGTTPYSYNWSSGGTTDTETGLPAGNYTVTVTDANNCMSFATATINEPAQLVVSDSIIDVSCSGNNDGAIYLSVTGGTSPYSYAWSTGGTGSSETGLTGGTYTVTITDNNSCSITESYTVNESAG
jgi:hypothetical protein